MGALPEGTVPLLNPSFWFLVPTAMLLLSGALVSGPYALITTAVSADLVSGRGLGAGWGRVLVRDGLC